MPDLAEIVQQTTGRNGQESKLVHKRWGGYRKNLGGRPKDKLVGTLENVALGLQVHVLTQRNEQKSSVPGKLLLGLLLYKRSEPGRVCSLEPVAVGKHGN